MKYLIKITQIGLLIIVFTAGNLFASEKTIIKSAKELIERITPGYSDQIKLEVIPDENGKDVFEVDKFEGNVCIRGNNPVSLASGFNWYLKYTCNAQVSWCGDQLDLPEILPLPNAKERIVIDAKHRFNFNYCTFNYTASWWDWARWERELDFLAMNGVNMVLSTVGQEGIWYNALMSFGFNDQEARAFLAGPAFLAWQWMTNIQSHGGPLPKHWIDTHIELGKKIIDRELSLGMKPVQQGFTGFVPLKFMEKFPDAKILKTKSWGSFEGTAQLDPLDPLFNKFGKVFYEEQKKLFGAHGYYAADPFHEGHPPVNTTEYLNSVGKAVYKLMEDVDSNALWLMQAWSIRKDIATVIPKNKLLILDLGGGKWRNEENFWGYDFVVGSLNNFGGRINMHGDLQLLSENKFAKAKELAPNAIGSGLFMEAIEVNPAYFNLAYEMPLHNGEIDIHDWLKKYTSRRYGKQSDNAYKAWQILLKGPYGKGTDGTEFSSIICARPAINAKKSGPNRGLEIPYNPQDLITALDLLLRDGDELASTDGYRFDIVDVQRQMLTNLGQEIHKKAAEAFLGKDINAFDLHSKRFLELLSDVDRMLKTRSEFSFDRWVSNARKQGKDKAEKDFYEYNASLLVTQWGGVRFFDYSWREWSGLISGYYLPRWEKFYAMLRTHLENGTEYVEEGLPQVFGREQLRANDFYAQLDDWEKSWIKKNKKLNPKPVGDDLDIVKELFLKYKNLSKEYYK